MGFARRAGARSPTKMPPNQLEQRAHTRLGTALRGKYRLDSVLGVGGMAVVYRATHRNQAEFAIKMLHPELSLNDERVGKPNATHGSSDAAGPFGRHVPVG